MKPHWLVSVVSLRKGIMKDFAVTWQNRIRVVPRSCKLSPLLQGGSFFYFMLRKGGGSVWNLT